MPDSPAIAIHRSLAILLRELVDGSASEAAWRRLIVTESEWTVLRDRLRAEAQNWIEVVQRPLELNDVELTGVIASVAHLAYHLGAIRQIDPSTRGPLARD